MRGNPLSPSAQSEAAGSIPACAGEPFLVADYELRERVYPRVCGGTLAPAERLCAFVGLSPRVRGNLALFLVGGFLFGSIPACAGEPCGAARPFPGMEVYPRVCGGTAGHRSAGRTPVGLSPRVRGNRV